MKQQVAAQAGNRVNLVEVNDNALQKAKSGIQNSLQRVAKKLYKVLEVQNLIFSKLGYCVFN